MATIQEDTERSVPVQDLMRAARENTVDEAHDATTWFTSQDQLSCEYSDDAIPPYIFRHNGVRVEIERARELLGF
jgi:hypothetical protein